MDEKILNAIVEILKALGIIITASLPGMYSLLKQRSKDKTDIIKKSSEAESIRIDTTAKIQEIYQEMLDDIKKQQKENMIIIKELQESVASLEKENRNLHTENRKLTESLENQSKELTGLKVKVSILIDQLKRLGVQPDVDVTRPTK